MTAALKKGLFPTPRSHMAAVLIADAADRDGRWCFLRQATLAERSGGNLSVTTAQRAIDDLVRAGLVRKLPREHVRVFFAEDLAAGHRRPDALPDVLELLIPAEAFPADVLERVNEARALLGEEPLTPRNRPAPPTTGRIDTSRPVTVTGREVSDRPTDPYSTDPHSSDPSPDPVRGQVTTGRPGSAVPLPRTASGAEVEAEVGTASGAEVGGPTGPRREPEPDRRPSPRPTGRPVPSVPRPRTPGEPAPAPAPAWALDLLRPIPDAALTHPRRDRGTLAARLVDLRASGVSVEELTDALTGWQDTARPFPALRTRLVSPESVRAWNGGALLRALPRPPAPPEDAFSRRPAFASDARGKATGTCPAHPSVRNVPGGTCALCGGLCRTEPDEIVHPPASAGAAPFGTWLGPPDVDTRFPAPKCDNERCNPDRGSPRYRTVLRPTPDGREVTAVPCPTCGHPTDERSVLAA
ncbi:helix-turn-helix domain-containing protein [Nocardiopsis sp. N85]|uniref:helix-turn-helix domain-containing protein n=1 Tax=Nocardiopsis sp. N85 TaxID=3029400 RepID=UPI00237F3C9F|nr:helix-turn-helix domain-containing protein [Nocardiopsis sp. N85]MDE3724185.1 helix-turn-helix domain-containing protein [Nocardiopsis sp. N85]